MENLISKLNDNNLIIDNNILLEIYEDGKVQSVDQETFLSFFDDSFPNPTYEKLIGSHTFQWNGETLTKTGEELGYKPYFDKWKELGII